MGNVHNSRIKNEIEWPRNEYGYLKTKIPAIDSLFERAGRLFDDFEMYRISIRQKLQKAHEIAGTDQLENPPILSPFRILLWTYSATFDGNLKKNFHLVTEPYFTFEIPKTEAVNNSTFELLKACDDVLKTFSEASNAVPILTQRAVEIYEEINDLNKPENLKLIGLEAGVAVNDFEWIVEKNSDMFTNFYNFMFTWNDIHLSMGQEFTNLITNINNYLKEADLVGKEALPKRIKEPKEMLVAFQHYL